MSRIPAADNLLIEVEESQWRLLANGAPLRPEQILLEVTADNSLRYVPSFGAARRLPESGVIAPDDIQRVVVGWSKEDRCWHLGLLFNADFARQRGGRWCELALWYDPQAEMYAAGAAEAGRTLAAALDCPFVLVPPKTDDLAAPAPFSLQRETVITRETAPAPETRRPLPMELPGLPLHLSRWTVTNRDAQLVLLRARGWAAGRVGRVMWYAALTLVYLVLAVATIRGDIALPNAGTMLPEPRILPYLGLVTVVILIGLMLFIVRQLLSSPRRFTFLDAAHSSSGQPAVTGYVNNRERWTRTGVKGVYVSQVLRVRRDKRGEKERLQYAEINLLLADDRFQRLLFDDSVDDSERPLGYDSNETVIPLMADNVQDELQAAGIYIAGALGVPCYYDRRVK